MKEIRIWVHAMNCHVTFRMQSHTKSRLSRERFRGRDLRKAGNFCRWETVDELFADEEFVRNLAGECRDELEGKDLSRKSTTRYVTVPYPNPVGWSCTDDISKYRENGDALEPFRINEWVVGTRVKRTCRFLPAPKTSLVTLSIEFEKARDGIRATVLTVYPGPSIGRLRPDQRTDQHDISRREGVVFFDPTHDGERLASPA